MTEILIHTHSLSRRVLALLDGSVEISVLAVFARVCNLRVIDASGAVSVITLVSPDIGSGSLNIVVDAPADWRELISMTTRASYDHSILRIGAYVFALKAAALWEPAPNWRALRMATITLEQRAQQLMTATERCATSASMLMLLPRFRASIAALELPSSAFADAARIAMAQLAVALRNPADLPHAARQLAGLGPGLTPAGDDFLAGTMLALWLLRDDATTLCAAIVAAAAPQTTLLAAALLHCAAAGECNAVWQALLAALCAGDTLQLVRTVRAALACGHSSGGDMLAGFIFALNIPAAH